MPLGLQNKCPWWGSWPWVASRTCAAVQGCDPCKHAALLQLSHNICSKHCSEGHVMFHAPSSHCCGTMIDCLQCLFEPKQCATHCVRSERLAASLLEASLHGTFHSLGWAAASLSVCVGLCDAWRIVLHCMLTWPSSQHSPLHPLPLTFFSRTCTPAAAVVPCAYRTAQDTLLRGGCLLLPACVL